MCEICRTLLSEGLDLCVRARKMVAQDRSNAAIAASVDGEAWVESGDFARYVTRQNITYPDQPMEYRSGSLPLWLQDQYDADLATWERKSRAHLQQGCGTLGQSQQEKS